MITLGNYYNITVLYYTQVQYWDIVCFEVHNILWYHVGPVISAIKIERSTKVREMMENRSNPNAI